MVGGEDGRLLGCNSWIVALMGGASDAIGSVMVAAVACIYGTATWEGQ